MANKIYPFTTPANYTYDSDKIEVAGGVAKLKAQIDPSVYAHWHLNEATGATIIDSSGNGRDGTPANSPPSVAGKLNNCLSFNGVNQNVNCGDIASFERTDSFSIECWLNFTSSSHMHPMSKWNSAHRGWMVQFYQSKLRFGLYNSTSNKLLVETLDAYNDGLFHHTIITYDGTSSPTGVNIYIDSNLVNKQTKHSNLSATIINTSNCDIGSRDGGYYYNGLIDEVVIYDKELSQPEVTERWNNGDGTEEPLTSGYPSDKPTIKPTTSWEIVGLSQFTAFTETLGGGNQGNLAYQLSDDDGVTWRYWDGSAWIITTDLYNDATTVHANIDAFPVANEKIMFRAFLISDGLQQCELDATEFTAVVGFPPIVYAGADKICYDHETKKPYSDATISDPDGDIEQASAWYDIEGSGWVNIPKGGYGTLQEAIRNFQYEYNNIALVNCQLKIIDEDSKETIDDMNMDCQKYDVLFNIKDTGGDHLSTINCNFGDGTGWHIKNSPFHYYFDYNAIPYSSTFAKTGFVDQHVDVSSTNHTEDITMQEMGAVDPAAVADAVWDEKRSEHIQSGSYGKAIQEELTDIKTETDKIQTEIIDKKGEYKADITELETLLKRDLGLSQENFRIFAQTYDGNDNLLTGTIKIYNNKADCDNDVNPLASYTITASYNVSGTLNEYKVVKN